MEEVVFGKSIIFIVFVSFLLSVSIPTVGCSSNLFEKSHPLRRRTSHRPQDSEISVSDLKTLLFTLDERRPLNFELIFDQNYQDTSRSLLETFSSDASGAMAYQYDSFDRSPKEINRLIRPARSQTDLVTLCNFESVLDIFRAINVTRLESHLVNWILIFRAHDARRESMDALQSLIFEGTMVTVVTEEKGGKFSIYSANVEVDGVMRFRFKGHWENSSPNTKSSLEPLFNPGQYDNMNGRRLIIAGNHDPPYFILGDQLPDKSFIPIGGIDYGILESLKKMLNFTYKVITPPDGGWGYPQPDGTITGMVGMVARREIHLAVSGIAMNAKRKPVIDFTISYNQALMTIFSRAPKLRNRAMAILSPFQLEIWVYLFITALAIGPVLKIHSTLSQSFDENVQTLKLQTYSFNMFRNLVTQGNQIKTNQWSLRTMFFSWYLFCLIVHAVYSGTLTAVLAIPAYEKPIDYLEDLPEVVAKGYTLTVMADSTNELLFRVNIVLMYQLGSN
ncbi:glutamate receptor ionotropic, kainate 4-like [Palaemon carinicauda]|uniref:glutamate receptor ionotropic, kainate 4-like n=1 Tax=Palaemon carinicauda TaxID=392227 RepID=UPI0035B6AAE5